MAPTGTSSFTWTSPAVANGAVYVGSTDGNTYALNAATGAKLWNYTTGGAVASSPALANGVVYVGSRDHKVYAIGNESETQLSLSGIQIHITSSSAKQAITYAFSGMLATTGPKPVGVANAKILLQWAKDNTNWSPATATPAIISANGSYAFKRSLEPATTTSGPRIAALRRTAAPSAVPLRWACHRPVRR